MIQDCSNQIQLYLPYDVLRMFLFSVEQLELIRRLRETGITAELVVEAYRQLEQFDSMEKARRMSQPPPPAPPVAVPPAEPVQESVSPALLQHLRAQNPVPVTISATSPIDCSSPERLSVQTVPAASTASAPETPAETSSHSQLFLPFENNNGGRPIRSLRTPMKEITTLDDPAELEEFMIQGEEGCINDMKQFITQFSLRQTTVAMMTGVSQPYISKLLNGNHRELSLRCRKNIYCWYLNCRRHPEKLSSFLADPASRLETNGDGELVPQRRERYVFRPILIRMLEGFFAQTPFPDLNRRIEIATACNHVLQLDKKGVGLMPKEVVSPQVVANWFANKRKEIRRRSTEAGEPGSSDTPTLQRTPMDLAEDEVFNDDLQSTSGSGSSPSPRPNSSSQTPTSPHVDAHDHPAPPLNMLNLAARLGLVFPSANHDETSPNPVSSLASQILNNHFFHNSEHQSHQPLPMVSLASQLLSSPQISLANGLGILPAQFPGLTNDSNNTINQSVLSMAYDQLRSPLIKQLD